MQNLKLPTIICIGEFKGVIDLPLPEEELALPAAE